MRGVILTNFLARRSTRRIVSSSSLRGAPLSGVVLPSRGGSFVRQPGKVPKVSQPITRGMATQHSTGGAIPPPPHYLGKFVVRYSECDQQGVVFNSHYQAMCDAAMDLWMRDNMGRTWCKEQIETNSEGGSGRGFSMVVASEYQYLSSAKFLDDLLISCSIARWGNASYDVMYLGEVEGRRIFEGRMTYVCIGVDGRPTPIPQHFREHMVSSRATRSKL